MNLFVGGDAPPYVHSALYLPFLVHSPMARKFLLVTDAYFYSMTITITVLLCIYDIFTCICTCLSDFHCLGVIHTLHFTVEAVQQFRPIVVSF